MELEEKLDYTETVKYFHALADVRFKLLALVPLITGAAVGILQTQKPELVIPVSIFGLLVTVGVIFYDQRNSQIYNAMQRRAKSLEALLKFNTVSRRFRYGGAFLDRPQRKLRFFGFVMWHDRGLAIVYAAVLAVWTYLLVNSLVQVGQVAVLKMAIPVLVFIAVMVQFHVLDEATDELGSLPEHIRVLLQSDSITGGSIPGGEGTSTTASDSAYLEPDN